MKINKSLNSTIIFILVIIFFAACSQKEETVPVVEIKPNPFNLEIDDLIEVRDTIEQGQTLSDILNKKSDSMQER